MNFGDSGKFRWFDDFSEEVIDPSTSFTLEFVERFWLSFWIQEWCGDWSRHRRRREDPGNSGDGDQPSIFGVFGDACGMLEDTS